MCACVCVSLEDKLGRAFFVGDVELEIIIAEVVNICSMLLFITNFFSSLTENVEQPSCENKIGKRKWRKYTAIFFI